MTMKLFKVISIFFSLMFLSAIEEEVLAAKAEISPIFSTYRNGVLWDVQIVNGKTVWLGVHGSNWNKSK